MKGLDRGLAVAPSPLVRSLLIVLREPSVEIGLQLLNPAIELLAERHAVELVEQRLVEAFADAVGLRASRLGARVIDVFDRQVQLLLVGLRLAAELGLRSPGVQLAQG